MLLAVSEAATGVPSIICTLLLIATVVAFLLGLLEVLGLYSVGGTRAGNGRFGTLVVAVILLIIYVVIC